MPSTLVTSIHENMKRNYKLYHAKNEQKIEIIYSPQPFTFKGKPYHVHADFNFFRDKNSTGF